MRIYVLPVVVGLLPLAAACAPESAEEVAEVEQKIVSAFGIPIADFNGDGFADLAVGVPGDDILTTKGLIGDAGSVHIFYGRPNGTGLSVESDIVLSQDSDGVPGDARVGNRFGAAIAVGDFNGDHISDLAIGAPGESEEGISEVGSVTVLYGSIGAGISGSAAERMTISGYGRTPTQGDHFGAVLAAGDMRGSGVDVLAIGVPDFDSARCACEDQGAVFLAARGRSADTMNESFFLEAVQTPSERAPNESFGGALAFVDQDGDGMQDLIVGVPRGRIENGWDPVVADAGYFALYHSLGETLGSLEDPALRSQGSDDMEDGDQFGASIAVGDFDGDGRPDLAVAVPGEDRFGDDAGGVNIFYNDRESYFYSDRDEFFSQAATLIEGAAEDGDHFGAAVLAGDFNGDGYADLAIGVPGEKEAGDVGAGAVNVIYGREGGLSALDDQFFAQSYDLLLGKPHENEAFGSSLARGDFNTDGITDLVVGVPRDVVSTSTPTGSTELVAGEIEIIRGSASEGLTVSLSLQLNRETPDVAETCSAGDLFGAALGGG